MSLREWLMILGVIIFVLIIADGIRRVRKSSSQDDQIDDEERARQEELRRELPSGGARVIKTHDVDVFDNDPIPVLRHEVDVPYQDDGHALSRSRAEQGDDYHSGLDSYGHQDDPYYRQDDSHEQQDDRYGEQNHYTADQDRYADTEQDDLSGRQPQPDEHYQGTAVDSYDEMSEESPRFSDAADYNEEETSSSAAEREQAGSYQDAVSYEPAAQSDQPQAGFEPEQEMASEETLTQQEADDPVIVDSRLDDLEPLEKRFDEARASVPDTPLPDAEVLSEPVDPVQAAIERIRGKHTGPRPSERLAQQQLQEQAARDDDVSLAEQQYLQQQEDAARAEALRASREKAEASAPKVVNRVRERKVSHKPILSADQERDQIAGASELLVLHVKCKDPRGFHGAALLHVVMHCGMQIGDMKVFHRFVKTEDGPQIQFSMMSSVEPGVFDIDQIDDLYIPSVSFVMGLPAPGNSRECFSMMLETAKVIARNLNGELRDENRSVMTPQTVEHYKQRIQEFERRKQLARMR